MVELGKIIATPACPSSSPGYESISNTVSLLTIGQCAPCWSLFVSLWRYVRVDSNLWDGFWRHHFWFIVIDELAFWLLILFSCTDWIRVSTVGLHETCGSRFDSLWSYEWLNRWGLFMVLLVLIMCRWGCLWFDKLLR